MLQFSWDMLKYCWISKNDAVYYIHVQMSNAVQWQNEVPPGHFGCSYITVGQFGRKGRGGGRTVHKEILALFTGPLH